MHRYPSVQYHSDVKWCCAIHGISKQFSNGSDDDDDDDYGDYDGGGDDDDVQKVNDALVSDITAGYHLLYSQEGTSIINC
jgi:hypothetical protein